MASSHVRDSPNSPNDEYLNPPSFETVVNGEYQHPTLQQHHQQTSLQSPVFMEAQHQQTLLQQQHQAFLQQQEYGQQSGKSFFQMQPPNRKVNNFSGPLAPSGSGTTVVQPPNQKVNNFSGPLAPSGSGTTDVQLQPANNAGEKLFEEMQPASSGSTNDTENSPPGN